VQENDPLTQRTARERSLEGALKSTGQYKSNGELLPGAWRFTLTFVNIGANSLVSFGFTGATIREGTVGR